VAGYYGELVGFVLFVGLILWKVAPPLLRLLDKRRDTIRSTIEGAAAMLQAAEEELEHRKALLEEAEAEAVVIRERAAATAAQLRADGHERAEEEYARLVAAADDEIGRERQRALGEVSQEVGRIVVDAAERVVRAELDAASQRSLVDQVIEAAVTSGALP
jgi:F-type H+-transporting ATPase subunit b